MHASQELYQKAKKKKKKIVLVTVVYETFINFFKSNMVDHNKMSRNHNNVPVTINVVGH